MRPSRPSALALSLALSAAAAAAASPAGDRCAAAALLPPPPTRPTAPRRSRALAAAAAVRRRGGGGSDVRPPDDLLSPGGRVGLGDAPPPGGAGGGRRRGGGGSGASSKPAASKPAASVAERAGRGGGRGRGESPLVIRLPDSCVEVTIPVPGAETRAAYDRACSDFSRAVAVPGFRSGGGGGGGRRRIPPALIENAAAEREGNRYALRERAVRGLEERLVEPTLREEHGLEPIGRPELDPPAEELAKAFEPGEPMDLRVRCDVWPDIKWKDVPGREKPYFGLKGSYRRKPFNRERFEKTLSDLRDRYATLSPAEEGAALRMGDACVVDMVGYFATAPWEERGDPLPDAACGRDVEVVLGKGRYMEGLVEGLVGARVGETRTVYTMFPPNLRDKKLAGKRAIFDVTVKRASRRTVPEIDDDLASRVRPGLTAESLMEELRGAVDSEDADESVDARDAALAGALADVADVDVPDSLITRLARRRFTSEMTDPLDRGADDGEIEGRITPESFLRYRAANRDDIVGDLRVSMAVEEIARAEGIDVPPRGVDEKAEAMRGEAGDAHDEADLRSEAEEALRRRAVFDFLAERADLDVEYAEGAVGPGATAASEAGAKAEAAAEGRSRIVAEERAAGERAAIEEERRRRALLAARFAFEAKEKERLAWEAEAAAEAEAKGEAAAGEEARIPAGKTAVEKRGAAEAAAAAAAKEEGRIEEEKRRALLAAQFAYTAKAKIYLAREAEAAAEAEAKAKATAEDEARIAAEKKAVEERAEVEAAAAAAKEEARIEEEKHRALLEAQFACTAKAKKTARQAAVVAAAEAAAKARLDVARVQARKEAEKKAVEIKEATEAALAAAENQDPLEEENHRALLEAQLRNTNAQTEEAEAAAAEAGARVKVMGEATVEPEKKAAAADAEEVAQIEAKTIAAEERAAIKEKIREEEEKQKVLQSAQAILMSKTQAGAETLAKELEAAESADAIPAIQMQSISNALIDKDAALDEFQKLGLAQRVLTVLLDVVILMVAISVVVLAQIKDLLTSMES